MNFVAVFLGGGIGALFRYVFSIIFVRDTMILPFHTLFANFLGCFIAGMLITIFSIKTNLNPINKVLLITGFCGGLTTFSTFSLETINLLQDGFYAKALAYIVMSLLICIISVILGMLLVKKYV